MANWFGVVRRKFLRQSHKTIIVLHNNNTVNSSFKSFNEETTVGEREEAATSEDRDDTVSSPIRSSEKKGMSKEDIAAIKIQATFRGHLARRAYKALRSLVKLQALVRGVCVRKQTRVALHCMHALVRLQVRVRARQLLSKCSDDN